MKQAVMGTTERKRAKNYPGPGAFDLPQFPLDSPSLHASRKSSILLPSREPKHNIRNGPGSHHPRWFATSEYKNSPSYKICTKRKSIVGRITPHSNLEAKDYSNFKTAPRFKFGTKDRFSEWGVREGRGARRPDPGQYAVNDSAVSSSMLSPPAYSVSPNRGGICDPTIPKDDDPGPGFYHAADTETTKFIYKASPRAKFGTARRLVSDNAPRSARGARLQPGPGQYNSRCTRHGGVGGPAWTMPGRGEIDLSSPYV